LLSAHACFLWGASSGTPCITVLGRYGLYNRRVCSIHIGRMLFYSVAGQFATIRFGRSRRPRGPTYARGTNRSLFENQEQARQRMAHDVATRPPCRNLFRDAHFEIIQFVCAVSQFIFSLSGQGSFFVDQFTFSFRLFL
jgi:hypothetical protein